MLILALDTAGPAGGCALARDGRLVGEVSLNLASTHSRRLLVAVDFLMEQAQVSRSELEGLAVTLGPGYFTGLRIGLATAQGLALGLGLPCAGVSTLRLLAQGCAARQGTIWAVMDARKELVYAAPFGVGPQGIQRQDQDAAMSPRLLAQRLEPPALLVGSGARAHAQTLLAPGLCLAPDWAHTPRPGLLALLGEERLAQGQGAAPQDLQPRYLRPSDAEINFGLPLDQYRLLT